MVKNEEDDDIKENTNGESGVENKKVNYSDIRGSSNSQVDGEVDKFGIAVN